jgi:hypothetical protein
VTAPASSPLDAGHLLVLAEMATSIPPPRRPWVFAVEPDAVQVTWTGLGPGPLRWRCADTVVELEADGGPGEVVLDGLPADRSLVLELSGDGAVHRDRRGRSVPIPRHWRRQQVHTLPAPPGEELFRFATISDLHIGAVAFGFRALMVERPVPDESHPERATRAALDELTRWGAQLVLIKGDLTDRGQARDWDAVGRVLTDATIPVEMLPGNHDHYGLPNDPDPYDALAHLGHEMRRHVTPVDVPGLRIVLVDSTDAGKGGGHLAHHQRATVAALRESPLPAFVTTHHYAQRLPVPTFWPPGVPSPEANSFFEAIIEAQPASMFTSGHTHRHRRRHLGPLVLSEVGSPKDFPGTWAGYVVHEGGIRQVVRRVARPDVLRWTDRSARAALGMWGCWAPGILSHRCFTHPWPT